MPMPHNLQNQNWPQGVPKWMTGSRNESSFRLLDAPFNIHFDSSTPSIRKVDNREKEKETKRGNKEYNDGNT